MRASTFLAYGIPAAVLCAAAFATVAERRDVATGTPGFLDGAALSASDREETAGARAKGHVRQYDALWPSRDGLSRRDVELLRQDRRRAEAAYPEVPLDDLLEGRWMHFDEADRVPQSMGGANRSSVKVGGRWYLEGASLIDVVRPRYTKRADAAATSDFLAHAARYRREALLSRRGFSRSTRDPDGSDTRVSCSVMRGCVVRHGEEGDAHDLVWRFAYVPSRWLAGEGRPTFRQMLASGTLFGATPRAESADRVSSSHGSTAATVAWTSSTGGTWFSCPDSAQSLVVPASVSSGSVVSLSFPTSPSSGIVLPPSSCGAPPTWGTP